MEDHTQHDDLSDRLKNFAETNLELVKMQAVEKMVRIIPGILSGTMISLVIYLSILFLSFGLSIYLSDLLNSTFYGFLIVGSFYLLLGIIFIIARKKIIVSPLRNILIKAIFKQHK